MWNIKLVDIGGDGLVTEFDSMLNTLDEIEILVESTINQQLAVHCVRLNHVDELVYDVLLNGHEIGIVSIKDVNPVPAIRK